MPRKRLTNQLYVYYNDIYIGDLIRPASGHLQFKYSQAWLDNSDARPISLSMPLTEAIYEGDSVYNYFDNLLPDSELIRERIQARFQIKSKHAFDLLASIGSDCIGALQLLPEKLESHERMINVMPIDDSAIAKLLMHYKSAPLGMAPESDFRISIAGAQEKTALLFHNNQWCVPLETTPTSHIIKLPIGFIEHTGIDLRDSVENEWLCLQILAAFDLPVSKASINYFDSVKTLVVERFDRQWVNQKNWLIRLPQEDMCQALGIASALKYESDGGPGIKPIMQLLQGSMNANADRERFMKTVFLFWVLGGIDGHAKNFSVFLKPGGRYQLTPIYDVMSAYPLAEKRQIEWRDMKMAMSLKGKNTHYHWHVIYKRHWLAMAEQCQFPINKMQAIIDDVRDNIETVITQVSQQLPADFPSNISDPIFSGMRKIINKL